MSSHVCSYSLLFFHAHSSQLPTHIIACPAPHLLTLKNKLHLENKTQRLILFTGNFWSLQFQRTNSKRRHNARPDRKTAILGPKEALIEGVLIRQNFAQPDSWFCLNRICKLCWGFPQFSIWTEILFGDIDCDGFALGVVEAVHRGDVGDHGDAVEENDDENEAGEEAGQDRDGEEPSAVVGTSE